MKLLLLLIFLFCLSAILNSQTLNGIIYDAETTVKGAVIKNKTQNSVTSSDSEGKFNIETRVNDTLTFSSLFHHPLEIIIKSVDFNDVMVIELKKVVNELDEVIVTKEPEQPVFDAQTYNTNIKNIISEDIKKNPHLYRPAGSNYGVDFIYLIGQVAKLFKKKKPTLTEYGPITYEQLDSLFRKSTFFTDRLLTDDLKIPLQNKYLFFDFCSAKNISSEMLKDSKRMELLDQLVLGSQLYLLLLEQYGKEEEHKD